MDNVKKVSLKDQEIRDRFSKNEFVPIFNDSKSIEIMYRYWKEIKQKDGVWGKYLFLHNNLMTLTNNFTALFKEVDTNIENKVKYHKTYLNFFKNAKQVAYSKITKELIIHISREENYLIPCNEDNIREVSFDGYYKECTENNNSTLHLDKNIKMNIPLELEFIVKTSDLSNTYIEVYKKGFKYYMDTPTMYVKYIVGDLTNFKSKMRFNPKYFIIPYKIFNYSKYMSRMRIFDNYLSVEHDGFMYMLFSMIERE